MIAAAFDTRAPSAEPITSVDEKYISSSIMYDAMTASVTLFLDGTTLRDDTGALDQPAIRARLDAASWSAPALRKRLRLAPLGLASAAWVPVDRLDLDYHVQFHPGVVEDGPAAAEILSGRATGRLDRDRPVWRTVFVELSSGDVALIFTWHHVMGDAAYGLGILRLLFDETPSPGLRTVTGVQRESLGRAPRSGVALLAHLARTWWTGHASHGDRWTAYRSRPLARRLRRWAARLLRAPRDEVIRRRRIADRIPRRHHRLLRLDLATAERNAARLGGSLHDLTVAATLRACLDTRAGLDEAALLVPISHRRRASSGGGRNVISMVRVAVPAGLPLAGIVESARTQVRRGLASGDPAPSGSRLGYATMVPSGEHDRYFGPAPIHAVAGWPAADPRDEIGVLATSYADSFTVAVSTFVTTDIDGLVAAISRALVETEDPA